MVNRWLRGVPGGIFGVAMMVAMPAIAQDADADPSAWQAAVSGQIEAFRLENAEAAYYFASAPFHTTFPSADAFYAAIVGSGYAPIGESRTHSFGSYTVQADATVLQQVNLVGTDQSLYGAVYQLTEEPEGWRVLGVQLLKQPGIGI